jgi:hypothetical protein
MGVCGTSFLGGPATERARLLKRERWGERPGTRIGRVRAPIVDAGKDAKS